MTKQKKKLQNEQFSDVTHEILSEHYNPLYSPLSPSYDELTAYADDLDYWGNQISFEWASSEIMTHRMGWVRVGLVADRVRRYRLYQGKFADWQTYCRQCLGKDNWQVNKIIKAAKATLEIIRHGAYVYPTCMAHIDKLLECCKKTGVDYLRAWDIVAERLPEQMLITARSIGEVLGFPTEENRKLNIPRHLRDRLQDAAFHDGVSVEEKINQLLDMEQGIEPEEADEEETASDEEKEQAWRDDLKQLVEEHDGVIWLMTAISKLINQGKRKVSQFSYLRQLPCQT